jgi:CBS domain containing-hemolysin-like protein
MELILALAAIIVQAAFSGSETSLVRANWVRVRTWARENRLWAGRARLLLERRTASLITTLIGTSLFLIIASTLSEDFFVHSIGRGSTFLSVLVVSAVSLFFAMFLPKAVAQQYPELWLSLVAPLLQLSGRIFTPLIWGLSRISGAGSEPSPELVMSRKDVLFALREATRREGAPWGSSGARLGSIAARLLDFPELLVGDVMTPNDRVVAVPEEISDEELRRVIARQPYTRLPVYRGQKDNAIGVVGVRDLLLTGRRTVRPPFFVATQARAIEVMNLMQNRGEHMALVQNVESRTVGIVTLEDLVEELVGEIRSEE